MHMIVSEDISFIISNDNFEIYANNFYLFLIWNFHLSFLISSFSCFFVIIIRFFVRLIELTSVSSWFKASEQQLLPHMLPCNFRMLNYKSGSQLVFQLQQSRSQIQLLRLHSTHKLIRRIQLSTKRLLKVRHRSNDCSIRPQSSEWLFVVSFFRSWKFVSKSNCKIDKIVFKTLLDSQTLTSSLKCQTIIVVA